MAGEGTPTVSGELSSGGGMALKRRASIPQVVIEKLPTAASRLIYSRVNQALIDSVLVALALCAAYLLRFDGELPVPYFRQLEIVLPVAVLLYLILDVVTGAYDRVWRFFGLRDAAAIARVAMVSFLVSIVWRFVDPGVFAQTPIPIGILLIHPMLAFAALVGARLTRRVLYDRGAGVPQTSTVTTVRKRLLLAGAGEAGLHLLKALSKTDFKVVGFVDDDPELQRRTIAGWRVLGTTHELESLVRHYRVDEVILCMPSAPRAVLQRIVARCEKIKVKTSTVPTLWEIMSGTVAIGHLRPVNMEDLLGRHSITHPEDLEELTRAYRGSRILVTGAGGSIGSELVRQLSRFQPSQLILLDKDENNLYEIACEVKEDFDHVTEVVANIRNLDVMEKLFELYRPEVVFHAAAYKHVPLMEHYPAEAILNNVMGTRHVADLSNAFGVKIFVLISTDKAVNPSSTMGASKRVAELLVQELAATRTNTRFCCVRFGNVLGSRASVVPIFQRQIRQGKNITVTHPDVSRYFMTIPEAVQLVIQAGTLGEKGEIFLLDMGDPVKIVDLARNLIELSGLMPDRDVTIEFTGLRPGEKLDEELLIAGEHGVRSTRHSKIFVVGALNKDRARLQAAIRDLEGAAHAGETAAIHRALRALNIGYHNPNMPRETPAGVPDFDAVAQPARPQHSTPNLVSKRLTN
jgi:FlaA1/EpsC-like NDP-sugar epimerase